jgi:hypothetical protein
MSSRAASTWRRGRAVSSIMWRRSSANRRPRRPGHCHAARPASRPAAWWPAGHCLVRTAPDRKQTPPQPDAPRSSAPRRHRAMAPRPRCRRTPLGTNGARHNPRCLISPSGGHPEGRAEVRNSSSVSRSRIASAVARWASRKCCRATASAVIVLVGAIVIPSGNAAVVIRPGTISDLRNAAPGRSHDARRRRLRAQTDLNDMNQTDALCAR